MGYTKEQREAKKIEQSKNNLDMENNDVQVTKKKLSINNLPLNTAVLVRSNCFGNLVYISRKTGFITEWTDTHTPQYLTLEELLIMGNTQPKFFIKNWVVIDGFVDKEYADMFTVEDILDFLHIKQHYKHLLCPEDVDQLFKMQPAEIEKRLLNSTNINRDFIIIRANELIENRELDSLSVINTLEKIFGCELSRPS